MDKFKFISKNKIENLPKVPGVYALKKGAKLLYIGKAGNLKERIKQHKELLSLAKQIGYIKTGSEFAEPSAHLTSHPASQGSTIEALILEANLIKKYKPKYNVVWRDDKNYFFVGITKEDFPRIFLTHQIKKLYPKPYTLNPNYIGPFVDGTSLKQTLKILRKIFPYRSCKNLPKRPCPPKFLEQSVKPAKLTEPQKLGRACLWYQLLRCPAPCLLKGSNLGKQILKLEIKIKKECQENVKNIIKILQGKKIQVITDLKKEMKKASLSQDFERAAKIRDKIRALEKVLAHANPALSFFNEKGGQKDLLERAGQKILQKILKTKQRISRIEAYDISNIQGKEATGAMVTFIKGLPDKKFYRKFKIKASGKPNDIAMLKECLIRRFNHPEWGWPDLILIDGGKAQLNAAILTAESYKLKAKVIALAKKKNELYIEGKKKPVLLKNLPREIFNLILQLRDEAHRFAISYHHKLREIDLRESLC